MPLSSIVPFDVSLKTQFGSPGMLPAPSIVIATFVPLSWPLTDADTVRPFAHDAVKVPAIEFAVCAAIVYWKLPQVLADGSVGVTDEVHTPTMFGEFDEEDVGVDVGGFELELEFDEGDRMLDECSKPHAPTAAAATISARRENGLLVVMAYKPVPGRTVLCAVSERPSNLSSL